MTPPVDVPDRATLKLALPKGRMYAAVVALLAEAGIDLAATARDYRPRLSVSGLEVKVLKPQAIVEMLDAGSRDLGFAGADWVAERQADIVEILDTQLDPVRLVVAAPAALLEEDAGGPRLPSRPLRFASEYERLTRAWMSRRVSAGAQGESPGVVSGDRFVRSYGATEVLPPEDADAVVDITASGATLEANGLTVVDELMRSSTRLYASRSAMADPPRRLAIETLAMLLDSVLAARRRVMLEVNVVRERLDAVARLLPCMREPTVSPLVGANAFAVKGAVLRSELPALIPAVRRAGGTDIVITSMSQVIP